MQLYDKDLLSVQEVRELIQRAKSAQQTLAGRSQSEIDEIIRAIADAGVRNAVRLGNMAQEETGFGVAEDKMIKNVFGSRVVYDFIRVLKVVGVLEHDEKNKTYTVGVPMGVIAGLIPSTNPTSTVFYKAIISLKAGNSIVFSPHPNAKNCILATVSVIRQAIAEAGANEDLVSCITIPTAQATNTLMSHRDTALILATGGAGMVRAAYSSGTPALGVGPGNGPAYIERTADIPTAVRRILASKTFDNGTICASEQSIITETDLVPAVKAELERQGGYFLSDEQSKKLGKFILRGDGRMNPQIVGRSAHVIAELAGIDIPADTKVLIACEDGIGYGHPYSNEKLAPILAFFSEDTYQQVCERCVQLLMYEGAGHTFCIHTEDQNVLDYFVSRIPASRIIVNAGGTMGGIGATTHLMPSMTLGCGAEGGSATSDNVGPLNLINKRVVAYGLRESETVREEALACQPICKIETGIRRAASDPALEDIVLAVLKKIQDLGANV